jgi:hypothetical protein
VIETDGHRPKQFLTDLVQAMSEAARSARQASIDQCRSEAAAYTESLLAGKKNGADALHRAAVADVGMLRQQYKVAADRIVAETAERVVRRNMRLEDELRQSQADIEAEIKRVGERMAAFEAELAGFCEQLRRGSDPQTIVKIASAAPRAPIFETRTGSGQAAPPELLDRSRPEFGTAYAPRTNSRPRSG